MRLILLALICVVVFFWGLIELGPSTALVLAVFLGLDAKVAVPLGFLIAGTIIAVCIYRGLRDGLK